MGDGTEKNPYTRQDVLRLIEENGGKAEGLDLSGKYFEKGIDLSKFDLEGINLAEATFHLYIDGVKWVSAHLEGADLSKAHLEGVDLRNGHLEGATLNGAHFENAILAGAHLEGASLKRVQLEGAHLNDAHLEGADLTIARLDGANLWDAHLEGAYLWGVEFPHDTKLEGVHWGNYILGEETFREEGSSKQYLRSAEASYRRLKIWHTEHGIYDVAGEFFYREMEAKRKAQSWKKEPHLKLWSWVMRLLCGYGEKPERVVISAAVVIFGLAAVYCFWGSFNPCSFSDTLYYSVASFTALGYGNWAPQPTGWAKGMGAAEAVLGVFMMALFLVTFIRKMTR